MTGDAPATVGAAVVVAVYEHRHGKNVRAFANERAALEWRAAIAEGWWDEEFDDERSTSGDIGAAYFESIEREYFSVHRVQVEASARVALGSHPSSCTLNNEIAGSAGGECPAVGCTLRVGPRTVERDSLGRAAGAGEACVECGVCPREQGDRGELWDGMRVIGHLDELRLQCSCPDCGGDTVEATDALNSFATAREIEADARCCRCRARGREWAGDGVVGVPGHAGRWSADVGHWLRRAPALGEATSPGHRTSTPGRARAGWRRRTDAGDVCGLCGAGDRGGRRAVTSMP
jgi:hypothetical protein